MKECVPLNPRYQREGALNCTRPPFSEFPIKWTGPCKSGFFRKAPGALNHAFRFIHVSFTGGASNDQCTKSN